ncbi:MAG: hypothetical protein HY815_10330 [Candidatus Riflebacteria bacterium]|nr:hypothetical protein [Candidatus Riflebacteria bacterium]
MEPLLGIVLFSLVWAFTGHFLFLFYRFLWRWLVGLLGGGSAASAAGENPTTEAQSGVKPSPWALPVNLSTLADHSGAIVGLVGVVLAVSAFNWLVSDLVSDTFARRAVQLLGLIVLTAALLGWGFILRRRGPDPLGTGLMLVGFFMIPIDAAFYETHILGYSTRSAYFLLGLMALLAVVLHRTTTSRTFAWIAPQCATLSLLAVGHRLQLNEEFTAYLASLAAPLFLALSCWPTFEAVVGTVRGPFRLAALLLSLSALGAALSSTPEAVAWLHLMVGLLGGGTLAVLAYLVFDLRALVVVIPYTGALFAAYFSRFSATLGPIGGLMALAAVALLGLERTIRTGAERRQGLDPRCAVPAVSLLLTAVSLDSLTVLQLLARLSELGGGARALALLSRPGPDGIASLWFEGQKAVFYLSRLDSTFFWCALSLPACAAALVYVGARIEVAFFGLFAGVPLAIGLACALMYLLPWSLWSSWYGGLLLSAVVVAFAATLTLRRRSVFGAHLATELTTHVVLPLAYLTLLYPLEPAGPPGWLVSLVLAVLGGQAILIAAMHPALWPFWNVGIVLLSLCWPLSIAVHPYGRGDLLASFFPLVIVSLAVTVGMLWIGLARRKLNLAVVGGTGLVLAVLATTNHIAPGDVVPKIILLAAGLGMLYGGFRFRRSGGPTAMLLLVSMASSTFAAGPVITQERLHTLAQANPDDSFIVVTMAAAGRWMPPPIDSDGMFKSLGDNLSSLSGIDSAAAALQIADRPLRLTVAPGSTAGMPLSGLVPVRPTALDYPLLARRLPGAPALPDLDGDELAQVPADRIQLRFAGPGSLSRILSFYEDEGRAILSVTSPGLSLPGPDAVVRRTLGVGLAEATKGCRDGVLSIGDPYLDVGSDLVLIARFDSDERAAAREREWRGVAGEARTRAIGRLALLATTPEALDEVVRSMERSRSKSRSGTLGRAADFRYLSLLSLSAPDGLLFIGEAVVARLISPGFWVASRRRADCRATLAELEAARTYGSAAGRALPDDPEAALAEAVQRRWIAPGTAVHGGLASPLPLRPDRVDRLHETERHAYLEFSNRYEALYGRFIDPIAVGISAQAGRIDLDTVILPVARQPAYQELIRFVAPASVTGSTPIRLPGVVQDALAAVAFRYAQPAVGSWLGSRHPWLPWRPDPAVWRLSNVVSPWPFGSTVGAALLPGDPLFFEPRSRLWADPAPLPLVLFQDHLRESGATAYLSELLAGQRPGCVAGARGSFDARVYGRRHVVGAVDDAFLHLGTSPDQLATALKQPVRSGRLPGGTAWMSLRPASLWKAVGPERAEVGGWLGDRCRRTLASLEARAILGLPWPSVDPDREVDRATGLPPCPGGGIYACENTVVRCSVHGTVERPVKALPLTGSALHRVLDSLHLLEVELALLSEGIRTRLAIVRR